MGLRMDQLQTQEKTLTVLVILTAVAFVLAVLSVFFAPLIGATHKWLATFGVLATITGVVQLVVSKKYSSLIESVSDEKEYPYGPPSRITRKIIDNPDRPVTAKIRNLIYFDPEFSLFLTIFGLAMQIFSVWYE